MFDIFIKYVWSSHQSQNSLTEVNVTVLRIFSDKVHSNNTWRIDCYHINKFEALTISLGMSICFYEKIMSNQYESG